MTEKNPLEAGTEVSVVIPVKDDSAALAVCLAALRAQSRPADEIIVVDNASTDNSAAIAAAGGAKVLDCPEPGIPAASSRGYDAAAGDLILRLDADCTPAPSWIDHVVTAFHEQPRISALTGSGRFTDGPVLLRTPLALTYLCAYTVVSTAALGHRPLFGSNFAMRREAWQAIRATVHRADPELHDDLDLSFHIGEHYRVGHMRSPAMGISMRPFRSVGSFRHRIRRVFALLLPTGPVTFPH